MARKTRGPRSERLIKAPVFHWNDPAPARHVGAGPAAEPTGAQFENLGLGDLLAWRELEIPRPEITSWCTASGLEVDFVVERGRSLPGIEVKPGVEPWLRDVGGLAAFVGDCGRQAIGGLVLHGGSHRYWLAERILALARWAVL